MPLLIRYHRPILRTALGITKAKKRFNKAVGITAVKNLFAHLEISSGGCYFKPDTTASRLSHFAF